MNQCAEELKNRTKLFAQRVIRLSRSIPTCPEGRIIQSQLLRSATAVAANYRAACRARSDPDFASKIGIVLEEADESVFWLELLVESALVRQQRISDLMNEANQLVAIFAASRKTAMEHRTQSQMLNLKS